MLGSGGKKERTVQSENRGISVAIAYLNGIWCKICTTPLNLGTKCAKCPSDSISLSIWCVQRIILQIQWLACRSGSHLVSAPAQQKEATMVKQVANQVNLNKADGYLENERQWLPYCGFLRMGCSADRNTRKSGIVYRSRNFVNCILHEGHDTVHSMLHQKFFYTLAVTCHAQQNDSAKPLFTVFVHTRKQISEGF
eukprot:g45271.t1